MIIYDNTVQKRGVREMNKDKKRVVKKRGSRKRDNVLLFNKERKQPVSSSSLDSSASSESQKQPDSSIQPKKVIQISLGGVITIVVTIAIAIVGATWHIGTKFTETSGDIISLSKDIEGIKTEISRLETEITDLKDEVSAMNAYLYNDEGVKDQLGNINEALNIKVINVPLDEDYSLIKESLENTMSFEYGSSGLAIDETSGLGIYKGTVCYAKDNVDEPLIITYTEEDKEVYFYGSYNEKYHWNGYCITNTYYLDGSLAGICESYFEDGERLDYISFYKLDDGKWIYSNRDCVGKENSGISVCYAFQNEINRNFTNTNVRISDILFPDKVIETFNPVKITYYFGNTSNGLYNDDTGTAYLVKYYEDGTVQLLYVGKFVNGYPNDKAAWSIAYSEEGGYYVHNTGKFVNGSAVKKSNDPLSIIDIKKIIFEYDFECELNWR